MNGIRYSARCLGIRSPHKLLRAIPRRCYHRDNRVEDNVVERSSSKASDNIDADGAVSCRVPAKASNNPQGVQSRESKKHGLSTGPDLADFILASFNNRVKWKPPAVEVIPYLKDIYGRQYTGIFSTVHPY